MQVRLGGKYLYWLRHLISPHFYYKIKQVVFIKKNILKASNFKAYC